MKNRPSITKEEDKRNKEISYHENETQGYVIGWMVEDYHLYSHTYIFLRISINALSHNYPGNQIDFRGNYFCKLNLTKGDFLL